MTRKAFLPKRIRDHERRTLAVETECSIRLIQEMEGMLEMLRVSEHFRGRLKEHRVRLVLALGALRLAEKAEATP